MAQANTSNCPSCGYNPARPVSGDGATKAVFVPRPGAEPSTKGVPADRTTTRGPWFVAEERRRCETVGWSVNAENVDDCDVVSVADVRHRRRTAKADAYLMAASPMLRDFVQRVANQTRETMGGCAGLVDDAREILKRVGGPRGTAKP